MIVLENNYYKVRGDFLILAQEISNAVQDGDANKILMLAGMLRQMMITRNFEEIKND